VLRAPTTRHALSLMDHSPSDASSALAVCSKGPSKLSGLVEDLHSSDQQSHSFRRQPERIRESGH